MRVSKNVLNNLSMDNNRRTPVYQTLLTDLALIGVVPMADAEMLLGYKIPDYLHTPDGRKRTEDELNSIASKLKAGKND